MAVEKKVFDVGKPGSAKPETGSKPMVIGHKTLLSDPTIKPESEVAEIENKAETIQKTEKKVDIKPLSEPEKEEVSVETAEKPDTEKQSDSKASTEPKPEAEEPTEKSDPDADKVEKKKAEDDLSAEQAEKLEAMIKSKEYFVQIKETNRKSVRTFVTTVVVVIVLGAIMLSLLIDAEVLDLGVSVPFDFL